VTRALSLWGPVLFVMALIFGASSVPNLTRLPGGISDHTGHFAAYAVLSAVCLRALAGGRWRGVTWRQAAASWGLSVGYGATDEWHQRFVQGRFATVDDWIADALGAAAAALALVLVATVLGRRREDRAV
jgi:VanZ family protein